MNHRRQALPRQIAPGIVWMSTCLEVPIDGRPMHSHNNCYLFMGAERTLLLDNGHAAGWKTLRGELETVLDGRPLDYLFPTHPETPHMGNTGPLLDLFPQALIVGDVRNYHLYFPHAEARLRQLSPGDAIDLGGMHVETVEAVVHDLPNTLWAYERGSGLLCVSDAFPYIHEHDAGQCGLLAEELPAPPDAASAGWAISRALNWIRYVDPALVIADLDRLWQDYPVRMIGPSHGGVITDPVALSGFFAAGLRQAWNHAHG